MAAATKQEKEPANIVHQNAIFRETIHKEQRNQKLYTDYGVNPYKKSMYYCIDIVHIMIVTLFTQCMCWLVNPILSMTRQTERKTVSYICYK